MRSDIGRLLGVDDEGALRAPAERQALPGRDLATGPLVLHVDGHRTSRCLEDVLRRYPDVRALGDDSREHVSFFPSDAKLLRPDPDLDGAGPSLQPLTGHADESSVQQ